LYDITEEVDVWTYGIQNVTYIAIDDETIFSVISVGVFQETYIDNAWVEAVMRTSISIYEDTMFSNVDDVIQLQMTPLFLLGGFYTLENGNVLMYGSVPINDQNVSFQAYLFNDQFVQLDVIQITYDDVMFQVRDVTLIDHVLYVQLYVQEPSGIFLTLPSLDDDGHVFAVAIRLVFDPIN
jgi:hypothetical protein